MTSLATDGGTWCLNVSNQWKRCNASRHKIVSLISAGLCDVAMLKTLISNSANVNQCNKHAFMALHQAHFMGSLEMAFNLIHNYSCLDIESHEFHMPLCRASEQGHTNVVKSLVCTRADLEATLLNGASALFLACTQTAFGGCSRTAPCESRSEQKKHQWAHCLALGCVSLVKWSWSRSSCWMEHRHEPIDFSRVLCNDLGCHTASLQSGHNSLGLEPCIDHCQLSENLHCWHPWWEAESDKTNIAKATPLPWERFVTMLSRQRCKLNVWRGPLAELPWLVIPTTLIIETVLAHARHVFQTHEGFLMMKKQEGLWCWTCAPKWCIWICQVFSPCTVNDCNICHWLMVVFQEGLNSFHGSLGQDASNKKTTKKKHFPTRTHPPTHPPLLPRVVHPKHETRRGGCCPTRSTSQQDFVDSFRLSRQNFHDWANLGKSKTTTNNNKQQQTTKRTTNKTTQQQQQQYSNRLPTLAS